MDSRHFYNPARTGIIQTVMKASFLLLLLLVPAMLSAASIYDYTLPSIDGQPAPLAGYKGKVLLIVNVASKCGYTPQYEGLQKLYETYKDRGLVIPGFPANNFGAQEPGLRVPTSSLSGGPRFRNLHSQP